MNCQRALEILSGLATGRLAFTADVLTAGEIEQLLALGLAVEADPRDMATLQWFVPAVQDQVECAIEDPEAPAKLAAKLAEVEQQLKSDWQRFTTGKDKIALREQQRRLLRRAVAVISDRPELERLVKIMADARSHGDPRYAACESLGSELYAITRKGMRVGHELAHRISRFVDQPFAAFLKVFDKAERKMAEFSGEIAALASHIGPVKKNPHQVVIGLAKTGAPPAEAIGLYRNTMNSTGESGVAVTCARHAASFGGPHAVAARLQQAEHALLQIGFARTPVVTGAARSLLPFTRLDEGAARFAAIAMELEARNLTRGDASIKLTARLMPAAGTPQEAVGRAVTAYHLLAATGDRDVASAIALGSMVQREDAVAPAVQRFLAIRQELIQGQVSPPTVAAADALECVACPGTPAEVVATVRALVAKLAVNREPRRDDVAIAVAFAKRFAY
jgi:hypothetical protein